MASMGKKMPALLDPLQTLATSSNDSGHDKPLLVHGAFNLSPAQQSSGCDADRKRRSDTGMGM